MKRETLRHPKTFDLASRLGIDRARALGILTLLWDFTADSAIQGDVGKWPNGSIARACDWLEDPDAFVEALVESKWIDRSSKYRLLIHDWSHHCERWVHLKMGKLGLVFASDEPTVVRSIEPTIEPPTKPSPPRDQTKPNQTEPNPPPPTPSSWPAVDPIANEWEAVVVDLHLEGLGRADSAVGVAKANRCDPRDVRAVLEHYRLRKPAWSPGALHDRILALRTGQDPTTLWPPASNAAALLENSAKRLEHATAAATERIQAATSRDAEFARMKRLEAAHGSEVDRLARDKIREIAFERLETEPAKLLLKKMRIPPTGMLRTELLEHFESVAKRPTLLQKAPVC